MSFHKNLLTLSILAAFTPVAFAQDDKQAQQLETLKSTAHPLTQTAADFAAADNVIGQKTLSTGAPTIGDALDGQLGVHTNQYVNRTGFIGDFFI